MKASRGWGAALLLALALMPWMVVGARAEQGSAGAEPLISPEEMLAVDQVRPGMKGYGRSVFAGTKIENFNVTVLGVLKKIDFGGDLILIRIDDGYPVTSGSGVSQGMSGSPIYVEGKLLGALAFAWPFAKDPVAGVTPISQMLENYRPGSAPAAPVRAASGDLRPEGGPLQLDGQLFAKATVVPDEAQAVRGPGTLYLAPVATPVMIAGMGRPGQEELKRRFGRYSVMVAPGPGKTELPPGERPKIEPGSAVGVQLLGGDIDATAIGTVTYVKGNHVVAFGHPMFGLGTIDMPMTTAYIHGIISSQEVSFKMGSPVETVGKVSQDRNWSIGGALGDPSRVVRAEFAVNDTDRKVHRDYKVEAAVHRDLTPSLLYSSLMSAVGSVSPPDSGTTRGVVEVWPKGMPVIRRENIFATGERRSQLEQLFGDPFAGMPLVELLQILDTLENNPFGTVPVERIRVAVDVSETRKTAVIERAYADRKSVKPGEKVKLGVVIRTSTGERETKEYEVEIPRNIPGGRLAFGVSGGSSAETVRRYLQVTRPPAKTLAQLLAQIQEREQNNQLTLEMAQPVVGVAVAGREFPNLPNLVVEVLTGANPSGIRMVRSHARQTHPMPWVLSGGQLLSLEVESDEKDKSGPPLNPALGGMGGLGSLMDLFRFGLGGDGELGGDEGLFGTEGDLFGETAFSVRPHPPANHPLARRLAKDLPTEPKLPTFEELEELLDEDGTGSDPISSEGGEATSVRKGLTRAPGVWRLDAQKELQAGKLDGVLISSRGELALAPRADTLLQSPDRFFWATASDRQGRVFVGGWLEGAVQRIDPDGKVSEHFQGQGEVAISALTCGEDGTLYAAAEPSGTIYKISPDGKGSPLCRLEGQRVWALRKTKEGLFAGTGSEGRLYRIDDSGAATVLFTAPDRHVFALADDGKGALYAGTYPRGKVFRVTGDRVEPLYELSNSTVSSLACDASGSLYIGTSPRATVVKLDRSGDASVLFQSRERHVHSMLVDEQGNVFAAVGRPARVYRIAPDKTVSTVWDPQSAYVLSLSRDGAGNFYATTAGPTQVVRLSAAPSPSGTYTSPVLNAKNLARWGVVRWIGSGEGVQVQTRSGNTAYPDSTWSDWSAPITTPAGQPVASPGGQYLQYRVRLSGNGGTGSPSVRSLELFYRTRNRAPEITVRGPSAGETLSGTRPIRWTGKDPDGDRLSYDIYYAPEGSEEWVKIGTRSPKGGEEEIGDLGEPDAAPEVPGASARAVPSQRPGRQAAVAGKKPPAASRRVPAAAKPRPVQFGGPQEGLALSDDDEASIIGLGGEEGGGAGLGVSAGGGGSAASINWDTRKVKDGRYRLRIVASDAFTSPDEPTTGEAVSEVIQVDNTGPRILAQTAKRVGPAPPEEVLVRDAGTYVASAEYRVDGGEWIPAAAADGIFDSAEETIRIDRKRLPPGRHTLEIRTRDAAGNEAVEKLTYVLTAAPKAPAGAAPKP
ncbi:MAG: SpoIVB peptidase S55 domain-containing protein [Armatimonadota bacterium]